MLAEDLTPIKARILALQTGLALAVIVLLANISLNIFGFSLPFLFIPLGVIYFWPRGAEPDLTYLMLFLCGLFLDFLSGSSPGVWAMIFLLGWSVTRPYLYSKEVGLFLFWLSFSVWMGILALLFLVLGYWGRENIAYGNVLLQLTVAITVFPILYAVRLFLKNTFASSRD